MHKQVQRKRFQVLRGFIITFLLMKLELLSRLEKKKAFHICMPHFILLLHLKENAPKKVKPYAYVESDLGMTFGMT